MNKRILYILAFLIKGWEVSLLLVLPIIQTQGKITVIELGILAAVFSIFQMMTSLSAGHLAEEFGSKKVMTVSILIYALCWLILSTPLSLFSLFIVYLLGGIGQGCFIPLANSQISKMADKNRASELGNFSAFADVGRVVLSTLTTFLIGGFGFFSASIIFGILAVTASFFLIRMKLLRGSIKDEVTVKQTIKIDKLLTIKRFVLAVTSGVFDVFASSSLYIFIPLLLIPKGIAVSQVGFISALFFSGFLLGRVLLGRLADKYGAVKILVFSQISMAILIFFLIFTNNLILISLILFILGVFTRGTSPVIRAMVAEAVSDKNKFDKAFSLHSFSLNSASIAARSVYGFSAGLFGISSVFYISALVALLTLVPLYLYRNVK